MSIGCASWATRSTRSTGIEGGYQLAAGTALPPLLVDEDEAVALSVGLRSAAGAGIDGIDEITVRVLAKLDQVLPDRLRRRVEALHTNVEVLAWAPTTTVPASSLTVLAQACRDREEVRFGYTRRDGEESRRLVRPKQLVTVGHRWYLVAYDVRRDDWRTFRVDRMVEPTLAGVRFAPLELPAENAAAFVAAGLRASTEQHEAAIVLAGEPAEIERLADWFHGDLTAQSDGSTHMRLTAESLEWLAGMIAILSTSFDIGILDAPDEVHHRLADAAGRLSRLDRPT